MQFQAEYTVGCSKSVSDRTSWCASVSPAGRCIFSLEKWTKMCFNTGVHLSQGLLPGWFAVV